MEPAERTDDGQVRYPGATLYKRSAILGYGSRQFVAMACFCDFEIEKMYANKFYLIASKFF